MSCMTQGCDNIIDEDMVSYTVSMHIVFVRMSAQNRFKAFVWALQVLTFIKMHPTHKQSTLLSNDLCLKVLTLYYNV